MELRQLEYFAAVARHRHFRRAAEESYVTQSALSQQVRRLEEELGLLLLRRTPHGVELTPAGRELAERADAILAEVAEARAAMDGHAGVERGVARIAGSPADAPRLPEALAAFHTAHPGIQIALRHGSAAEVVELLRRGAVALAVTGRGAGPARRARPPRSGPGRPGDPRRAAGCDRRAGRAARARRRADDRRPAR